MGYTGYTGAPGPLGTQGFTGATGVPGMIGNTGATGPMGYTGQLGATGLQGSVGLPGSRGDTGLLILHNQFAPYLLTCKLTQSCLNNYRYLLISWKQREVS